VPARRTAAAPIAINRFVESPPPVLGVGGEWRVGPDDRVVDEPRCGGSSG
jgi:hypothetical protein